MLMYYVGALGLVFGASQSRRLELGLFIFFSALAAVWISTLGAIAGHGVLQSIREGVIGAWSSGIGMFFGLILDCLVLRRVPIDGG